MHVDGAILTAYARYHNWHGYKPLPSLNLAKDTHPIEAAYPLSIEIYKPSYHARLALDTI